MKNPRTPPKNFPYADPRVPFISRDEKQLWCANTVEEKLALIRKVAPKAGQDFSPLILAVWPGKHRSDVFYINHRIALEKLMTQDAAPQPQ